MTRIGWPLRPMTRLCIGFLLASISNVAGALIQWRIYQTSPCGYQATTECAAGVSPVSLWYQSKFITSFTPNSLITDSFSLDRDTPCHRRAFRQRHRIRARLHSIPCSNEGIRLLLHPLQSSHLCRRHARSRWCYPRPLARMALDRHGLYHLLCRLGLPHSIQAPKHPHERLCQQGPTGRYASAQNDWRRKDSGGRCIDIRRVGSWKVKGSLSSFLFKIVVTAYAVPVLSEYECSIIDYTFFVIWLISQAWQYVQHGLENI
jgi:hypothetical protein